MNSVKENLLSFLSKLQSFQSAKKPSILFTTKYINKYQFISFIHLCNELKISPLIIGENRVQDAQEKIDYLASQGQPLQAQTLRKTFTFSMIGNLQKNKTNKALSLFDEIHAVDTIDLAKQINNKILNINNLKRVTGGGEPQRRGPLVGGAGAADWQDPQIKINKLPIFLEINLSGEPTKHGFKPEEIDHAISTIKQFSNLTIKGLMTMPPLVKNPEENRAIFQQLRKIADSYNLPPTSYNLKVSMGTSSDWKIALEENADVIRVGSTIFSNHP